MNNENENSNALKMGLLKFQEMANLHPRVESLIKNWDRDIYIEASDIIDQNQSSFYLQVRQNKVNLVKNKNDFPDKAHIHLRADQEKLIAIFQGETGPVEAYFEGSLECYASDEDQMKLDALTMILWSV